MGLPDEWLGNHARRRDESYGKLIANKVTGTLLNFGVAIALLDDWNLPVVTGNHDKWDFDELPLNMMAWVIDAVIIPYNICFDVKKNYSMVSTNGQRAAGVIPPSGTIDTI